MPAKTKKKTKKTSKKTIRKTSKKVTKKASRKATKKTPRKAASRTRKKPLVHAEGGRSFWVHTGAVLVNLRELEAVLRILTDAEYLHHVTKEKNDFADWVEFVLEDIPCAKGLRKAKSKRSAATCVRRRLTYYR